MKLNEPMSDRQRERLDQLKIAYSGDETVEEAADLLRAHNHKIIWPAPKPIPESALAVESEGDQVPVGRR